MPTVYIGLSLDALHRSRKAYPVLPVSTDDLMIKMMNGATKDS